MMMNVVSSAASPVSRSRFAADVNSGDYYSSSEALPLVEQPLHLPPQQRVMVGRRLTQARLGVGEVRRRSRCTCECICPGKQVSVSQRRKRPAARRRGLARRRARPATCAAIGGAKSRHLAPAPRYSRDVAENSRLAERGRGSSHLHQRVSAISRL